MEEDHSSDIVEESKGECFVGVDFFEVAGQERAAGADGDGVFPEESVVNILAGVCGEVFHDLDIDDGLADLFATHSHDGLAECGDGFAAGEGGGVCDLDDFERDGVVVSDGHGDVVHGCFAGTGHCQDAGDGWGECFETGDLVDAFEGIGAGHDGLDAFEDRL